MVKKINDDLINSSIENNPFQGEQILVDTLVREESRLREEGYYTKDIRGLHILDHMYADGGKINTAIDIAKKIFE